MENEKSIYAKCPNCGEIERYYVTVRFSPFHKLVRCTEVEDKGCGKLFVLRYHFAAAEVESFKVDIPS